MKLKILLSNNDKEINIPIVSRNNPLGYDDNIQNLVDAETNNSINTVTDAEVRRLKINHAYNFNFKFWNGSSFVSTLAPLEGLSASTTVKNSFFIIQVYDGFMEETQNKRHTGYFNGYEFSNLVSSYVIDNTFEFSDLYLPKWYLDSMTGTTTTMYAKFLFFSGKSGKFYSFYNANGGDTNQKKLYTTIQVTGSSLNYSYLGGSTLNLYELTNATYDALVNATVPSFPVQKPTYPTGNTFTSGGQYETI